MAIFLITFVICSSTIGLFFAVCIVGASDSHGWKRWAATFLISVAVGAVITGLFTLEDYGDRRAWNDGQCPSCSVIWELKDVTRYRNSTLYYWECPNCKNLITTTKNMRIGG